MKDKCVIYAAWCVCHPHAGIRYVGLTSAGINSRAYHHVWSSRNESSRSYHSGMSNWIRKHGADNIAFSTLEVCSRDELNDREVAWISMLRSDGLDLLNVLEGGSQPRGHKNPTQSRRMSGSNNPMYGKDRSELMAYARSFQGPATEETRRKMADARQGEKSPTAKLTEADVREIRSLFDQMPRYGAAKELSAKFGVSPRMISLIVNRKSWKHVE